MMTIRMRLCRFSLKFDFRVFASPSTRADEKIILTWTDAAANGGDDSRDS